MKKRVITWALVFALTAAVPAFGIFGIPSPEDLLIWFVLRPMMHGNQRAMIANQVRELEKLVEQLETARSQLTQVRDGAQGLVGAITDPMADLVATSTDLLNTARDWHADFTGPAGDMVGSVRNFANNGESFSRSWRDVLQERRTPSPRPTSGTSTRAVPMPPMPPWRPFERQRVEGEPAPRVCRSPGGCRGRPDRNPRSHDPCHRAASGSGSMRTPIPAGQIAHRRRSPRVMFSHRSPKSGP